MTRYGWIAISFLLAGCANSPPNRYYTLSIESPCPPIPPLTGHVNGFHINTIHLPGVLDRPQVVVRTGPQTVDVREFDRWAEPLDQMATRVLADDIAPCQRSPGSEKPKYLLSVSVNEFMTDTSGHAQLTGRWWILQKDEGPVQPSYSFSFSEGSHDVRGAESATSMSVLLGRLAGEIVRSLSRENAILAEPSA